MTDMLEIILIRHHAKELRSVFDRVRTSARATKRRTDWAMSTLTTLLVSASAHGPQLVRLARGRCVSVYRSFPCSPGQSPRQSRGEAQANGNHRAVLSRTTVMGCSRGHV